MGSGSNGFKIPETASLWFYGSLGLIVKDDVIHELHLHGDESFPVISPEVLEKVPAKLRDMAKASFRNGRPYFVWTQEEQLPKLQAKPTGSLVLVDVFYVAASVQEAAEFQVVSVLRAQVAGSGKAAPQKFVSVPQRKATAEGKVAVMFDMDASLQDKVTAAVFCMKSLGAGTPKEDLLQAQMADPASVVSNVWQAPVEFAEPASASQPAAKPPGSDTPLTSPTPPTPRTWTSNEGKSMQAIFVRLQGEEAVFHKEDGQEFSVPLSRLSAKSEADARRMAEK